MSRRKMAIEVFSAPGGRCADFDQRYLGYRRNMDAEGFVALQDPSDELADILLCAANSSFVKPIFWPAYPGRGIVLQLSVADAHAEYRRLRASAAPFALDLIDEPFNGRPFTLRDPAGMLVDVAQRASF